MVVAHSPPRLQRILDEPVAAPINAAVNERIAANSSMNQSINQSIEAMKVEPSINQLSIIETLNQLKFHAEQSQQRNSIHELVEASLIVDQSSINQRISQSSIDQPPILAPKTINQSNEFADSMNCIASINQRNRAAELGVSSFIVAYSLESTSAKEPAKHATNQSVDQSIPSSSISSSESSIDMRSNDSALTDEIGRLKQANERLTRESAIKQEALESKYRELQVSQSIKTNHSMYGSINRTVCS